MASDASKRTVLGLGPVAVPSGTFGPSNAPQPPLVRVEPGTPMGSYRVREVVASRPADYLCTAEHVRLGREVSLRILRPELAASTEVAERFIAEARAGAEIAHPNLAEVYDSLRLAERVFHVMEPLGTLSIEALSARGAVEPRRAVALALQLAELLQQAHKKGYALQALHAASIFVVDRSAGETLKAVDLTRVSGDGAQAAVMQDVAAVGALLAGLIGGALGQAQIQLPVDLPMPLQDAIRRCLASDPAARFPDMASTWAALGAVYADLVLPPLAGRISQNIGIRTDTEEVVRREDEETEVGTPRRARSRPWIGIALGVGIALLLGGGALFMVGRHQAPAASAAPPQPAAAPPPAPEPSPPAPAGAPPAAAAPAPSPEPAAPAASPPPAAAAAGPSPEPADAAQKREHRKPRRDNSAPETLNPF